MANSPRPSFVGQFVTKSANFGSSQSPGEALFNPRCHGVVIREFNERSRKKTNRSNLYAEVMLFPLGRIETIFKSKLFPVNESDLKSRIQSHPQYAEFQAKLKQHLKAHE